MSLLGYARQSVRQEEQDMGVQCTDTTGVVVD